MLTNSTGRVVSAALAALTYGLSAIGAAFMSQGITWHQPGMRHPVLQLGYLFALVFFTSSWIVPARTWEDLLSAIAWSSCSLFVLANGIYYLCEGSPVDQVSLFHQAGICVAVIVRLLQWIDQLKGLLAGPSLNRLVRFSVHVISFVSLGAGIGFLQGAAAMALEPNMVQDGGAVVGSVVASCFGLVLGLLKTPEPEAPVEYYTAGVMVCLIIGIMVARLAGTFSMFVTPFLAIVLLVKLRSRIPEQR